MGFLLTAGLFLAGLAIQLIFAKAPEKPKSASFSDITVPTIEEGTPYTVVFGTRLLSRSFIGWKGHFKKTSIKSEGGKK